MTNFFVFKYVQPRGADDRRIVAPSPRRLVESMPKLTRPAVVGETLYIGTLDGTVAALDTATGKVDWRFDADRPVFCSPAVADGVVYVAGYDLRFYALDAETGSVHWTAPLEDYVYTAPAVTDDTVYVGRGGVVALDTATGRRRWSRTGEAAEGALAVTDDCVITTSGIVEGLSQGNGQRQWQFDPPDPIFGSPVVAEGTVYVAGSGGRIYGLDVGTGAELWRVDTDAALESNVTVVEGGLFVGTHAPEGAVYALGPD
jgi:outer membrane protein assembly factor BamB